MPKGPRGEWRPTDPIANAVHVAKVLLGELPESTEPPRGHRPHPAPPSSQGGRARAAKMTAEERAASARRAAGARWERDESNANSRREDVRSVQARGRQG